MSDGIHYRHNNRGNVAYLTTRYLTVESDTISIIVEYFTKIPKIYFDIPGSRIPKYPLLVIHTSNIRQTDLIFNAERNRFLL